MPPNCLLWWRKKFVATPTYYNAHCHRGNCAIYWVFKFGSTTWKIDERINVWQEERERKKCESGSETEGTWQRAKFLELMMARADNLSANVVCHCWAFAFVVPSSPPAPAFPSFRPYLLLSMPLWVWRICAHFQINAAIIVYRWNCWHCWHCAQWLTCPAYLFALQLFHFSSVCQSNFPGCLRKQVQYFSPLSHSHFPDAIAMLAFCLVNEIDKEYILC